MKLLLERVLERAYEQRLGIVTTDAVRLGTVGYANSNFVDYHPIPYSGLRSVIAACAFDFRNEVFFDYGAGKGRALLFAARKPFRRVEGIELAPALSTIAANNIERARGRIRCTDVRVHTGNAVDFALPNDVTTVHFYNPFRGDVLNSVMENIARSLLAHPRRIRILFAFPDDFDRLLSSPSSPLGRYLRRRTPLRWRWAPDEHMSHLYTIYEFSITA